MAEPVGVLRALLSASSTVFEKDMKAARDAVRNNSNDMRTSLEKFQAGANNAIKSLFSLRAAAAVAAGATGLYYASKKAIELAGNIQDSARAAGLAADEYQSLRYAASQSGVGIEQFDAGVVKFNKTIGDAVRKGSEGSRVFKQLGIDIRDGNGNIKPTGDLLKEVAARLAAIEDPSVRSAFALELFGKANAKMADFLGQGADEIERLQARAMELGLVLSNDVVARAEAAGDEFETLEQIIKMGLTSALLETIPLWEALAKGISSPEFAAGVKSTVSLIHLLGKAIEILIYPMQKAWELGEKIAQMEQNRRTTAANNAKGYTEIQFPPPPGFENGQGAKPAGWAAGQRGTPPATTGPGYVTDDALKGADAGAKIAESTKQMQLQSVNLGKLITQYRDFKGNVADLTIQFDLQEQALQQNIDLSTKQGQAWYNAQLEGKKMQQLYEDQQRVLDEIRTPQESYANEIERLNELLAAGALNQDQYNRALEKAYDRFETARDAANEFADVGKEMGDGVADALEGVITKTKSAGDALKALALQMVQLIAKKALFEPIANTFGTFLGKIFSGVNFGGARAAGGPTYPGKSYLVGEEGPELFTPSARGNISPNDALGGGGGDTYYDFRGVDPSSVTRLQAELRRLAGPGVTEKRVSDAMKRGAV